MTGPSRALAAALLALCPLCGCGDGSLDARVTRQGAVAQPRHPFAYEDLEHPLLGRLRAEERLDEVVPRGATELEGFIALRRWARGRWSAPRPDAEPEPYPNALAILARIRAGDLAGGHCSEYAVVLLQACLALGHQARLVSLESAAGAGHRTVEVWSNDYDKWIVMDPFLDTHFERDGVPLGAVELHRALADGATAPVRAAPGPAGERLPLPEALALFHHVTVIMRNNHLSAVDPVINRQSLGLLDGISDGRPRFSQRRTRRADDLAWPLNQTALEIRGRGPGRGVLTLAARANMPGFARFEARDGAGGPWRAVPAVFAWPLARGESRIEVRAVNSRGVAGPPAIVAATWRPTALRWLAAAVARRLG